MLWLEDLQFTHHRSSLTCLADLLLPCMYQRLVSICFICNVNITLGVLARMSVAIFYMVVSASSKKMCVKNASPVMFSYSIRLKFSSNRMRKSELLEFDLFSLTRSILLEWTGLMMKDFSKMSAMIYSNPFSFTFLFSSLDHQLDKRIVHLDVRWDCSPEANINIGS